MKTCGKSTRSPMSTVVPKTYLFADFYCRNRRQPAAEVGNTWYLKMVRRITIKKGPIYAPDRFVVGLHRHEFITDSILFFCLTRITRVTSSSSIEIFIGKLELWDFPAPLCMVSVVASCCTLRIRTTLRWCCRSHGIWIRWGFTTNLIGCWLSCFEKASNSYKHHLPYLYTWYACMRF